MLTLNIDNPEVENYFHKNTDEMLSVLEALASNRAKLIVSNNIVSQAASEIQKDIEAYRKGELKTTPINQSFWDEMDSFIDNIPQK